MAKAKRQRRTSIRTMSADSSALDALESLERAERSSTETEGESRDDERLRPVAAQESDAD